MAITQPYGLILAGGQSLRMGSDKGLMNYKGKPQREYLFSLLSRLCPVVRTSCRADQAVPATLHPLVDHYEFPGPINGILTALHDVPNAAWLVLAVDMPFIDETSLEFLLDNRNPEKVATCFVHEHDQFPEPLVTIYEPAAAPALLHFAQSGNMSPRQFLEQANIHTLVAPNEQILLNINYPINMGPLL